MLEEINCNDPKKDNELSDKETMFEGYIFNERA